MKPTELDAQLSKIYDVAEKAFDMQVAHLSSQEETYNGRQITINDQKLTNFSSCSYLGLALDERVIQGAIDGVQRYGTSFPTSRSFVTMGYLDELENKLEQVFGYPSIVTTSTSLAHAAFLPIFINSKDVFICDHQVHTSVRVASQIIQAKGAKADIIRHSDLEKLEEKIVDYQKTHRHVWYLADGIYSMYGDKAPIQELQELLHKYENFHVYIDDAHGMSWTGNRGCGWVLHDFELHPRMVLSTSLGKAFGSIGGVLVCNNPALKQTIKACGSSFIFSSPVPPSVIGASIASADIHLTSEIDDLQQQLTQRIAYFKERASDYNIPLLGKGDTPIFFIPSGNPDTCFRLSQQLMKRGFYQSSAVFPSVPYNSGGARFTITNWLEMDDIDRLISALYEERRNILQHEQITEEMLQKNFKGIEYSVNQMVNP